MGLNAVVSVSTCQVAHMYQGSIGFLVVLRDVCYPLPSPLPLVHPVEIEVRIVVPDGLEEPSESKFGTTVTLRSAAQAVRDVGRTIWD